MPSVLLTWKVLFLEQDCQTGQDCRAHNRFVLRNRSSLPVWLRPSAALCLLAFRYLRRLLTEYRPPDTANSGGSA